MKLFIGQLSEEDMLIRMMCLYESNHVVRLIICNKYKGDFRKALKGWPDLSSYESLLGQLKVVRCRTELGKSIRYFFVEASEIHAQTRAFANELYVRPRQISPGIYECPQKIGL